MIELIEAEVQSVFVWKCKNQILAKCGGSRLSSQPLGRWRLGGSRFQGQQDPILVNKLSVVVGTCGPNCMGGLWSQAGLGKKHETLPEK
jgi:hypothetical protein